MSGLVYSLGEAFDKVLLFVIVLLMNLSTVTQKGQITLPVGFRRMLNLQAYDKVKFEKKKGGVFISKAIDIMDLSGVLKPRKNKGVDPLKAREFMETHYKRA